MRVDQRPDPVFQLRNHLAAAVVRGRVGGEEHQDVDVEPHGIAADLHVAFFEDVEEPDLHQLVEFRQLVHGEDAAVHARDEPEVQRLFGRHAGSGGQPRGIDFADHVGELRAGGQTLGVARFARPPGDRHLRLGQFRQHPPAGAGNGPVGVFMHRTPGDIEVWQFRIEKPGGQPHQAALGLSPSRRGRAGHVRRSARC